MVVLLMDFRSKYDGEGSIWLNFRSKYDGEGVYGWISDLNMMGKEYGWISDLNMMGKEYMVGFQI